MGYSAIPPQRISTQPLRDAGAGWRAFEKVLHHPRVRSDQSGVRHDLWAQHVRLGHKLARKHEHGSLVPGWAARQRCRRSVTERRSALGARRISQVHSGRAGPRHAIRRSTGNEPAAEAVKAGPCGATTDWLRHRVAKLSRMTTEPGNVRPHRWTETNRRPFGGLDRSVRLH